MLTSGGRHCAAGQERQWNDIALHDVKRCDLLATGYDMVQERHIWRGLGKIVTSQLNIALETSEKKRKEDTTQPMQLSLSCSVARCVFVGPNKAGLTNHIKCTCPYCSTFHIQGLTMHKRFCQHNPEKPK